MRNIRNALFVVLVVVAVFGTLSAPAAATSSSGCSENWEGPTGYSLICNTWPDPAVCWDEFAIEESCWDWCWNYAGQQWWADGWGCEYEGMYQMEIWCSCWDPTNLGSR